MNRNFDIVSSSRHEIVVVGGGTTGISAALAAAGCGQQVLLVEAAGCLGGNSRCIPAWLGFHSRDGVAVVGGIPQALLRKLQARGGATACYRDPICGSVVGINTHWWKTVATEALAEAGVEVMLHSRVVAVDRDGDRISRLYVCGREGVMALEAAVVVDCTDSGRVASLSGETMIRGRESDGKVQVSSWVFEVANIDFEALLAYFEQHPGDLRPFELADPEAHIRRIRGQEVFVMGAFRRLIEAAAAEGVVLPRQNMPGIAFPKEGRMVTVAGRVEDVDPDDSRNLSRAEMTGALQVRPWFDFLRRYVPGCGQCRLSGSPSTIGIRETSHMQGRYTLVAEDLLTGRRFEDAIALGAYHLDIHSPDHAGLETQMSPTYSIPYRALLPRGAANLLVAGRAISATHEAMASTRVIPISMAQGQAAGTAAALAAADREPAAEIDIRQLQNTLRENGALIDIHQHPQSEAPSPHSSPAQELARPDRPMDAV